MCDAEDSHGQLIAAEACQSPVRRADGSASRQQRPAAHRLVEIVSAASRPDGHRYREIGSLPINALAIALALTEGEPGEDLP